MTSRNTRRTRTQAAVLATAGALALALLPASTASASITPTPPASFAYIGSAVAANPNRALMAADATGAGASALTLPGYQTYSYDVSPDGNTTLVAARTGVPATNRYDSTYGLVLVRRDPASGAVTSTLLSVFWDANPVLANDGAQAFWLSHGVLYEYDAATGLRPGIGGFAPRSGETVTRLAVSSDGSHAAVMYANAAAKTARVLAAPVATGTTAGNYAAIPYGPAGIQPSADTFVWRGADTLIWSEYDSAVAGAPMSAVSATLPTDGSSVTVATPQPTLNGFYDLRQDVNGAWWAWKDDTSVTPTVTNLYAADDAALVGATATAPVLVGPRSDGTTTFRYTPAAATPPALQRVVNPAAAHPFFSMSATTVSYGGRAAYDSHNFYGGVPGAAYSAATAAEVDRGWLQRSYDGVHWANVAVTSGARPIVIGTRWFVGFTPPVARNTVFRWYFTGDTFTAAGYARPLLVRCAPIVTVRVASSGGYRTIYGAATRIGGTALLYRYYRGAWHLLQRVGMTSRGTFSFGRKARPRGTYKVVTVADAGWVAGVRQFKI
jgi:hypothetical protein